MRNTRCKDSLGKHSTSEKVLPPSVSAISPLHHNLQIASLLPVEIASPQKSKQTFENLLAPSLIYPTKLDRNRCLHFARGETAVFSSNRQIRFLDHGKGERRGRKRKRKLTRGNEERERPWFVTRGGGWQKRSLSRAKEVQSSTRWSARVSNSGITGEGERERVRQMTFETPSPRFFLIIVKFMPRRVVYARLRYYSPKGEGGGGEGLVAASWQRRGGGEEGGGEGRVAPRAVVFEAGTYIQLSRRGTRRNFSRLFMDHHRRRLNFEGGHLPPPTMLTIFSLV